MGPRGWVQDPWEAVGGAGRLAPGQPPPRRLQPGARLPPPPPPPPATKARHRAPHRVEERVQPLRVGGQSAPCPPLPPAHFGDSRSLAFTCV